MVVVNTEKDCHLEMNFSFKWNFKLNFGGIIQCYKYYTTDSSFDQNHMTLKHVTCYSFPWNKTRDFRTPILCPNVHKNKIEAANTGKCMSYITSN